MTSLRIANSSQYEKEPGYTSGTIPVMTRQGMIETRVYSSRLMIMLVAAAVATHVHVHREETAQQALSSTYGKSVRHESMDQASWIERRSCSYREGKAATDDAVNHLHKPAQRASACG